MRRLSHKQKPPPAFARAGPAPTTAASSSASASPTPALPLPLETEAETERRAFLQWELSDELQAEAAKQPTVDSETASAAATETAASSDSEDSSSRSASRERAQTFASATSAAAIEEPPAPQSEESLRDLIELDECGVKVAWPPGLDRDAAKSRLRHLSEAPGEGAPTVADASAAGPEASQELTLAVTCSATAPEFDDIELELAQLNAR